MGEGHGVDHRSGRTVVVVNLPQLVERAENHHDTRDEPQAHRERQAELLAPFEQQAANDEPRDHGKQDVNDAAIHCKDG